MSKPQTYPNGKPRGAAASTTSSEPFVTPTVRKAAASLNVNLENLKGTGAGGRISLEDVFAANRAALGIDSSPRAAAPTAAAAVSHVVEQLSVFNSAPIKLDVYGPNPLLDDLRQAAPAVYALAVKDGAPPTLFASGDLPPLIASGEDPKILMRLPWFARHAGASADRGRLARMLEDAAEDPGGVLLQMSGAASADGVDEYRGRMQRWAAGGQKSPVTPPPPGWDDFMKQNGLA